MQANLSTYLLSMAVHISNPTCSKEKVELSLLQTHLSYPSYLSGTTDSSQFSVPLTVLYA